jgi:hypothetical protein
MLRLVGKHAHASRGSGGRLGRPRWLAPEGAERPLRRARAVAAMRKRKGKGLGFDAYHTEARRTRSLVKKKRCCNGFVDDGGLGGGRRGGEATGTTCSGDETALGQ